MKNLPHVSKFALALLAFVAVGLGSSMTAKAINGNPDREKQLGAPGPEPMTMLLLGTGLVSLAGAIRRRRVR